MTSWFRAVVRLVHVVTMPTECQLFRRLNRVLPRRTFVRLMSVPFSLRPSFSPSLRPSVSLSLCLAVLVTGGLLLSPLHSAEATRTAGEARDVLLMLDSGPLHMRIHVSVGKRSPSEARQNTIDRLWKTLDADGDGKLTRDEAQRSPLFREKQRPAAEQFLQTLGADRTVSRRDVEQRIERFGGETVVYRQNSDASETDSEVFKMLDADGNHVLNEAEMFDAVDRLLVKDSDDDECVTLEEFAPPQLLTIDPVVTMLNRPAPPTNTVADLIRDTRQTLLPAQLLKKYDQDRNRALSAEELGWPREKLAPCDTDGNGQLNLRELTRLQESPVDIELEIDVIRTTGERMLRVLRASGSRIDGDQYPDLATVKLPAAVISFSTREVDPFEASIAIAVRTFNELDVDKNGYLDRDESAARERFGRGLFDQVDADGDGKIFGEEMNEFIRSRGEPVATTCHVRAFDDGAGFFAALDANGDRRVSMREMRYADKTLVKMQTNEEPGLGEKEPARRYRIEFERGIFNPFGTPDRPANPQQPQTVVATAKPRAVGPIWFQRWDRNNDGDITFREFLGPRDDFERLDVDADDLIDPKEAEEVVRGQGSEVGETAATRGLTNTND